MACTGCRAVKALFRDANALAPNRSRASDGICASSQHHAQSPNSDHEPDSRGLAHAGDITHDPANGWDCNQRVMELVANKDARVKYIIWNKRIWRSYDKPNIPAWTPSPYTGSNSHSKHMHVSVVTYHESDDRPWWGGTWVITPGQPRGGNNLGYLGDSTAGDGQAGRLVETHEAVGRLEVKMDIALAQLAESHSHPTQWSDLDDDMLNRIATAVVNEQARRLNPGP